MKTPLVTVIIRAYNQADIIGRAIESVLAQKTDFDFEILLGEDCSTSDNTLEICQQYQANNSDRIRLMPSVQNQGFARKTLLCILSCKGEFIASCDGDDWWCDENRLQMQVDFLRANPDYVLIHSEMKFFDQQTQIISEPAIRQDVPQGDLSREIFTRHIINTPTMLYRRSAIADADVNGWLDAGFGVDDVPLWVFLAQKGKFHFEPLFQVVYSIAQESSCRSNQLGRRIKYMTDTYNILFYMWDLFKLDFPRKYIDKLYRYDLAKMVLSSRNVKLAVKTLPQVGFGMMFRVFFDSVVGNSSSGRAKICKRLINHPVL